MADLLLCPMCGHEPTLQAEEASTVKNGDGSTTSSPQHWYVVCDAREDGCGCSGGERHSPEAAVAVWNRRRVGAPDPLQDTGPRGYAARLAESIWRTHYQQEAPNWKPLPDLSGVLTQIDNMVTGLTKKPGGTVGRWERRSGYRGGGWDGLTWRAWEPCTEAEAFRIVGLRSWQARCVIHLADGAGHTLRHQRTGSPLKGCPAANAIKANHERNAYGFCQLCGDGPREVHRG